MNRNQFIELVFQNGERCIVSRSVIISATPTPGGVAISLAGEHYPKIVISPDYEELRSYLLSDNSGE